jgi:hypothetical protein
MIDRPIPPSRAARLAEIKRSIAAGTYDTRERLELALGVLLDDLAAGKLPARQDEPDGPSSAGESSPRHGEKRRPK